MPDIIAVYTDNGCRCGVDRPALGARATAQWHSRVAGPAARSDAVCHAGRGEPMQYLVDLKLADSGRSATPQEGLAFIEHYILPTLELCKKLQAEKKIIAGGPISGVIGMALIVEANSALELDEIIENLPMWPRMNTTITPLTTFDGRIQAILPRLERLKARLQGLAAVSR